jgi:hypothetical protein
MVNAGRMQKWNNNKEKGTTVADPLYVYASLFISIPFYPERHTPLHLLLSPLLVF